MRITRSALITHPFEDVAAWHERPGALVRLTPPGLGQVADPSAGGVEHGRTVAAQIGPGVLPGAVRPVWRLEHGPVTRTADELIFEDHQVSGPFRRWEHAHHLRRRQLSAHAEGATRIDDTLTVELPTPAGRLGDGLLEGQLDRLFGYRTRQLQQDLDFHARYAEVPRRTVAIAGVSGLIGTQIAALLTTAGHTVRRMVRGRATGPGEISWDPSAGRLDPADLEGVDAVITVGGRSIATRFTPRAKRDILSSRVSGTSLIARTLARMGDGPRVLVQASAIGAYGAQRPGELLTEADAYAEGFLAQVCEQWEAASRPAAQAGVRVVQLRTGIVLSDGGGALLPQLPLFWAGLGGRLNRPEAMLSWITLDDMARAYVHALLTENLVGPVNAVAPRPASAAEFARTLGRVLRRPSRVPVPRFGPRLLLGADGAAELVQADQNVSDERLRASGFAAAHADLETALRHVLRR